MQQTALESGNPLSTSEILDKVMGADSRSDYRPGRGYGPAPIGTSQRIRVTMAQLMDAVDAARTKERDVGSRLIQTQTDLSATRTELAETREILSQQQSMITQQQDQLNEVRLIFYALGYLINMGILNKLFVG